MLELANLNKSFAKIAVIQNLEIRILTGESVVLFAPSGAGKTTLLRIILDLEKPDSGSIKLSIPRSDVSTVFHKPTLLPHRTVKDNIFYIFKLKKIKVPDKAIEDYQNWINVCDLNHYQDRFPCELSAGMQQKVALIRSIIFRPQLLILDEPFGSIDLGSRYKIVNHLKKNHPLLTILLVTHNLDDIGLFSKVKVLVFKKQPLKTYKALLVNTKNRIEYRQALIEALEME